MAVRTIVGADIRGYYLELGIQLPKQVPVEASVRCFADPGSHRREDRDPSCSVNVINGAWQCHGCGARGGAYDAALAKGYTPRTAIDLMIVHGLIERRGEMRTARELVHTPGCPAAPLARARASAHTHARASARSRKVEPKPSATLALQVKEQDILRWRAALSHRHCLLVRLMADRGWRYEKIHALELGVDRGRITIPIRNADGQLRGLLRYQPEHRGGPKMLATPGTRLGLVPHPAAEPSRRIVLVEGPPDMIAARSRELAAIAVPGDHAWQPAWARLLARRHVAIVMDADEQGRAAAERIAGDLADIAQARIIDLAPRRSDGYDLTDWLLDHPDLSGQALHRQLGAIRAPRDA